MAKNNKNTRKTAAQVMEAAQAIQTSGPIDHHTQVGSWAPEPKPEEIDNETEALIAAELEGEPQPTDPAAIAEALDAAVPLVSTDEPEEQIVTFDSLVAELDPEKVDEMVVTLSEAIDERAVYEESLKPDNTSIQQTLKKVRAQFTASKDAARVLLAVNQDASFINRSISSGVRYNVYALGKLADIVAGLSDKQLSNAINLACMKSLFAFRAAGVPFTSDISKAAASDKIRVDAAVRKHLISHTVSASTAPTQASSTMQALQTLGIVSASGSRGKLTYTLTDHPAVAKLAQKLGYASAA